MTDEMSNQILKVWNNQKNDFSFLKEFQNLIFSRFDRVVCIFALLRISFNLCISCSVQMHSNAAIHFSKTAFIQLVAHTLYNRHTHTNKAFSCTKLEYIELIWSDCFPRVQNMSLYVQIK